MCPVLSSSSKKIKIKNRQTNFSKNDTYPQMQFVLGNLDVFQDVIPAPRGWLASALCVVLSLTVSFGHACGQAVTGNNLCARVMEMTMWNNQMKGFLLHLLHPPARSRHPSWAETNLNNFLFFPPSLFVTCSLHSSCSLLSSPLMPSTV